MGLASGPGRVAKRLFAALTPVALALSLTIHDGQQRQVLAQPSTPVATSTPAKHPVVRQGPFALVVVVDAARFDEMNPATMPTLAYLEAHGTTYAQAWVGQLPSVTETSHATIGTGVFPRRHTILGDTWRIPGTEQMSPNLLDANLTRTGYIGKVMQQAGVPSAASIVHQHLPGSRVVTLSGHKIYAADALGAGAADFVGFGTTLAGGHFAPSGIPGRTAAETMLHKPQLDAPTYPGKVEGAEDDWTTTFALKFLFKYHPRVMMVNLPQVDTFGHASGTNASVMGPALSAVDRDLGRLISAYGRAGMLSQTYIVVTSDHGMVPAVHTVSHDGIAKIVTRAGGHPLYIGHGDYSTVFLTNPTTTPAVARALSNASIPGVSAVYARNPSGKYYLVSSPLRLADPAVATAHLDLLNTLDVAEAPDIVLMYDENTITMTPEFAKIGRKGDHGGATWGAQHIPLVVMGPTIRQNVVSMYPARLVDIAPSVETFLGAMPQHQDGAPLADAMINPPAWATKAQMKHAPRLLNDVAALEREAALRPNLARK